MASASTLPHPLVHRPLTLRPSPRPRLLVFATAPQPPLARPRPLCRESRYDGRRLDGEPLYERLGAACFFDAARRPIAIWLPRGTRATEAKADASPPSSSSSSTPSDGRMVACKSEAGLDATDEAAQAAWIFRATLLFRSFTIDHLTQTHWLMANALVYSAKTTLSADHCLRRLLKPFTFGACTINHAAITTLTGSGGAVERNSSYYASEMAHAIMESAKNLDFSDFEAFLAAKQLSTDELTELPLAADGRRLWELIRAFFHRFLLAHYPKDAKEAQGLDAANEALAEDQQVANFWALAISGSMLPGGLEKQSSTALSVESLSAYLTRAVFFSTAVHELLGNTIHYVTEPACMQPRVHRFDTMPAGMPPQGSVQDYIRSITIAGTTQMKMPQLIGTMRQMAKVWRDAHVWGPHERSALALDEFANQLEELSVTIDADNERRVTKGGSAFHLFNPRYLECSVSL